MGFEYAARKYEDLSPADQEVFDFFYNDIFMGSDYWIEDIEKDGDTFTVSSGYGDKATFDKDTVLSVIADNIDFFVSPDRNDYYRRWGQAVAFSNWDNSDYDSRITDTVLQFVVCGKVKFA